MNMIERVAWAIDPQAFDPWYLENSPMYRDRAMTMARAAIEAMYLPTNAMTLTGMERRNAKALFTRDDAYHVFNAMIDAALKESD